MCKKKIELRFVPYCDKYIVEYSIEKDKPKSWIKRLFWRKPKRNRINCYLKDTDGVWDNPKKHFGYLSCERKHLNYWVERLKTTDDVKLLIESRYNTFLIDWEKHCEWSANLNRTC